MEEGWRKGGLWGLSSANQNDVSVHERSRVRRSTHALLFSDDSNLKAV